MKIAVVGPGAVGCLFASLFVEAGKDVWLLDKNPNRASQITRSGLKIEGIGGERTLPVKASSNVWEIGNADVVFICVKSPDTSEAAKHAKPLFKEGAVVLTMQNGLGNVERIAEVIGADHVIGGTTSQGATLLGVGHIRHAGKGETTVGEISGKITDRLVAVQKLLEESGITTKLTDDLEGLLWSKLIINVGINALTAITRMKNGRLIEYDGTHRVLWGAVNEAANVAAKAGIKLLFGDPVAKVEDVCRATAINVSSMLQDVLRKKHTEVEYINGAVARKAAELGIPAPVNETLTRLVKTIESSYGDQILSI